MLTTLIIMTLIAGWFFGIITVAGVAAIIIRKEDNKRAALDAAECAEEQVGQDVIAMVQEKLGGTILNYE